MEGDGLTAAASSGPRILAVRPDHLGDVLLTLPGLTALKQVLPQARIVCLVSSAAREVPEHCPAVDETLVASFPRLDEPFDPGSWLVEAAQLAVLLRDRFDVAILPRPQDPWSGAVVAAAAIPIRLGFAHPGTDRFLTHALPVPTRRHAVAIGTEIGAAAARYLGGSSTLPEVSSRAVFVPTRREVDMAQELLSRHAVEAGRQPFVVHPTSGWPLKTWPVGRWVRLVAELSNRYGVKPLVIGAAQEADLVDAVVRDSGYRAVGLAGNLSLGGLAALHRLARAVIGIDSGLTHLAALSGAPVVGLYGPADPAEFGPVCPPERRRTVRVQLPCSPCRTLLAPPCGATSEPPCMTGLTVRHVLSAIADLLASQSGPAAHNLLST